MAPRERIVQAVIDGLPELDPAVLTIQRVCARAQVTPPTIYYHFGSKEGMVAASVEVLVTSWLDRLDAGVDRAGGLARTVRDAQREWAAMVTEPSRPFAVFVWLALWSEASRPILRQARDQAEKFVADALVVHLGPMPDLEDLARVIIDGLLGAAVSYQLDGDEPALHRRLATLLSVVAFRGADLGPGPTPADL